MRYSLIMEVLDVAEEAAIASSAWNGKGDKDAADQAATTAMRDAFNAIDFSGRIVIGEGERDEAPMLYIGEELGLGGEEVDIAVDPLEGTNLCAYNQANSITAIAIAPRGALLYAPDTYMWKIAASSDCDGKLHINNTPADNVRILAEYLGKDVSELNVLILERSRHDQLIKEVREAGARVTLIGDGDVYGSIATALPNTGIDLYMGAGGSPEGVLACAGLKAIGGFFMGKLAFDLDPHGEEKRARALKTSQVDIDAPLTMDMLVNSDEASFIACGVTDGAMLHAPRFEDGGVVTESVVLSSHDKTMRIIKTKHCK